MKLALALLLLVPALAQEDPRVRELIERLSDDEIRVREKAAADLIERGKAAIPELQKLSGSTDLELKSRAASILRRIAEGDVVGRHWRKGPRITLVADGAPVASVLEDLARQAKDTFQFEAADLQDPVVLSVKDATFWDAVEALCRAAPALTWEGNGNALRFLRKERPPYPSKRLGEFAVWLDGITFNRDFDFTGNARSTFTVVLAAAWESGVSPVAIEQKITEVLDEDGANLMAGDRFGVFGGRMDVPSGRVRKDSIYTPLPQGSRGPRRFSKVKGYAAFYFPRSHQDVSIDLVSGAAPMTLDRVTIAMHNFRTLKDAVALELVVTSAVVAGEPLLDRLPVGEIAIVDERGEEHRAPTSTRGHSFTGTSYTVHENLQVPFPEGRQAKFLKLHILKDVMEKRVPFEFEDIRLE
jgi:hypothetical protein